MLSDTYILAHAGMNVLSMCYICNINSGHIYICGNAANWIIIKYLIRGPMKPIMVACLYLFALLVKNIN